MKKLALASLAAVAVTVGCTPLAAVTKAASGHVKPTAPAVATHWVTVRLAVPSGRTYILHYDMASKAVKPLVLILHGFQNSPAQIEGASGADAYAQTAGFNVAYPDGASNWDATPGTDDWAGQPAGRDDVTYLADVVTAAALVTRTDLTATQIWGFSKGGMMAATAACARPDVFAAVGIMSSQLLVNCANPINLMHIHGATDQTVPAYGGYVTKFAYTFPSVSTEAARLPAGSHVRDLVIAKWGYHTWATAANSPVDATAQFWATLHTFRTRPL